MATLALLMAGSEGNSRSSFYDEDEENSSTPKRRPIKRRRTSRDSDNKSERGDPEEGGSLFPAENLFEYQWPPDKNGDWYFVQEQVSEFLGVKSFKRKYQDLDRRVMEMDEKQYLWEKGVVNEAQVTLGLTALRSEEVYDLMLRDYPQKYQEYACVLHERERQSISEKHKEYEMPTIEVSKVAAYIKRAAHQAAEYNRQLNQERMEERRAYFDMQTQTIQVPAGKMKKLPPEVTKPGPFPVALIPGQFQEYYKKYTSEELKYFPLNTCLYGPPSKVDPYAHVSSGEESDEESSSDGDSSGSGSGSCSTSSSSEGESSPPEQPKAKAATSKSAAKRKILPPVAQPGYRPKDDVPNAVCGICLKGPENNKWGRMEDLIHCSQCDNSGHPSCLDMSDELVQVIKTYPWQCMECKTCVICGDPSEEDKMMFCDVCDRGFHTFCVGLEELPIGQWVCQTCNSADMGQEELPPPQTKRRSRAR
ncbi:PREDICTED: PHD finger protein 10-like isoform X6 [Branchiostoma belcheri]|uniref:PHD finger protein 10 n=1 Tax=Branchiostoma belcheri TaxID=7741 RepID=A0A6P4ZMK7_BRABE|nr:PREDICTED: PHD finger protein 10-like isoform X6 [Branchiostoma belcheri]